MVVTERKTKDGAARGDPRRGARRVRRARPPRRLDRGDRPPRRHLAAVRLPPLRHEEGALHRRRRRGASARRSRCSSARPRASAARRRCDAMGEAYVELLRDRPVRPAGADAGLRRLRRPARSARSSGTATATSSPTSSASPASRRRRSRVLRQRDAAERLRVDGAARRRRSRGRERLLEGCKEPELDRLFFR